MRLQKLNINIYLTINYKNKKMIIEIEKIYHYIYIVNKAIIKYKMNNNSILKQLNKNHINLKKIKFFIKHFDFKIMKDTKRMKVIEQKAFNIVKRVNLEKILVDKTQRKLGLIIIDIEKKKPNYF